MTEVIGAIGDKDPERARALFDDHLRNSDKELLRRIGSG